MAQRLTDSLVKALPVPAAGNKIYYDDAVRGLGCRVTAKGARSFILNYRTQSGQERRYTIGQFSSWKTAAARLEASDLKKRIDRGDDPLGSVQSSRKAPTVADLCERYIDEHLQKLRDRRNPKAIIKKEIIPALGTRKVADVFYEDIDALHRKITKRGKPVRANRVIALLSKLFSLAIRWHWASTNPCKGIERNPEEKRERYLSPAELASLTTALADERDQQAANILRLLLLTGARKGEVLSASWDQFDMRDGTWTKPAASTKTNKPHRVPLSAPALQLLSELHATSEPDAVFVFPSERKPARHREEIKFAWGRICEAAGLADCRVHDLRHTFASMLVSAGLTLPVIGRLLGHTQTQTTAEICPPV